LHTAAPRTVVIESILADANGLGRGIDASRGCLDETLQVESLAVHRNEDVSVGM
jgi:hypothetical protein